MSMPVPGLKSWEDDCVYHLQGARDQVSISLEGTARLCCTHSLEGMQKPPLKNHQVQGFWPLLP
jgi:hypothetical protein